MAYTDDADVGDDVHSSAVVQSHRDIHCMQKRDWSFEPSNLQAKHENYDILVSSDVCRQQMCVKK